MRKLVRKAAKLVFDVIDATFGMNSYNALSAKWERHVMRCASHKKPFHNDGLNIFCHPLELNSFAKTARDMAFKLKLSRIPFSLIDVSPPWNKGTSIPGRERDSIAEMTCGKALFQKSICCGCFNFRPVARFSPMGVAFTEYNNYLERFRKELFKDSCGFVCFSDFCHNICKKSSANALVKHFPIAKIRYPFIIPNKGERAERKDIRRKFGIPEDAFVVFFNFSFEALKAGKIPRVPLQPFQKLLATMRKHIL